MNPQPLVTFLTAELWMAVHVRQLQPLGLQPLSQVLEELGLPGTTIFAAVRHGLFNALRVIWVAGELNLDDQQSAFDSGEFSAGWKAST